MKESKEFDIVIIGGGYSGLTAAIYALRAGLKVILLEKFTVGGQAALTYEIANFPSYDNINGFELCVRMQAHAEGLGLQIGYEEVTSFDLTGKIKKVNTHKNEYLSKVVIISTGASSRKLYVNGEEKFIGKGVSYCATCDGNFYQNKTVAVVGGGNTAVEDALYLSNIASKVYLIHRRDNFRASRILIDKLKENSRIELVLDSVVQEVSGGKKVEGIYITNKKTGGERGLLVDGVFVAIGQTPNTDLFKEQIQMTDKGYILVDDEMRTNIDGVYASGDCIDKKLRQVITACSDGAIAGEMSSKYIMENFEM